MNRAVTTISVLLILSGTCPGTLLSLTNTDLGLDKGNYGTSLEIDIITLTALTGINGLNSQQGTIYIVNHDKGIGVQNTNVSGSKGISGKGGNGDEALVFNFNIGVSADSLAVGLNKYERNHNNTTLTLLLSDNREISFDKSHSNWLASLTSLGKKKVSVDIGKLLEADFSGRVTRLTVTETNAHLYVNSIAYGDVTHVPEPSTIFILAAGAFIFFATAKRKQNIFTS